VIRKLIGILLGGVICSTIGVIPVLAEHIVQYNTLADYEKLTGKRIVKFNEAPALRTMVSAGELPPVEKRLPEEVLVVEPVEKVGQYGGTLHRAWLGMSDRSNYKRLVSQRLVRFTPDVKEIIPSLATSWDISEGGKVFTFHLRKGVKWSDGHPFTADDLLFWYEDIVMNDELSPVKPSWMKMGGEIGEVKKVDDYTVQFRFAKPYGLFLKYLAASQGYDLLHPKHYMKQFHPRYTPKEKLDKLTKEAGFKFWYQLFSAKNLDIGNPQRPTLNPWVVKTTPTATRFIIERNPYYWKVDPAGNQLPYIDRVVFDLVEDSEMINFKAVAGELDFQFRHIMPQNFTLLMENRDKGGYRVLQYKRDIESDCIICLNITHKNPVLRKILGDRRFRIALSYAINREEINELCYLGRAGEPRQVVPFPESEFFLKELAYAYIRYDPELANTILDGMGLAERDKEGFRLRPDGKRLALTIEFAGVFGPWADILELVKQYWEAVGVKTAVKMIDRSLWQTRYAANEMDVTVWTGTVGMQPFTWPRYYVPTGGQVLWAPAYQRWYESGGKRGERPTEDVLKAIELFEQIKGTADKEKQSRLFKEILKLKAKYLWNIGTLAPAPYIGVASNKLRNVPKVAVYSDISRSPGSFFPEQFFFEK